MNGKVDTHFLKGLSYISIYVLRLSTNKIPKCYSIFKTMPQLEKEGARDFQNFSQKCEESRMCGADGTSRLITSPLKRNLH